MSCETAPFDEQPYDVHIVFVCTGNICRSPMAEVIFRDAIEDSGLIDRVKISSCGTGGWHVGQGADKRAVAELAASGYDGSRHRARHIDEEQKNADLLVALDSSHVATLVALGVPRENIRLLNSFNPDATGVDVDDPYYGDAAGFTRTRTDIEAAIPGLVQWTRTWCEDCSYR